MTIGFAETESISFFALLTAVFLDDNVENVVVTAIVARIITPMMVAILVLIEVDFILSTLDTQENLLCPFALVEVL